MDKKSFIARVGKVFFLALFVVLIAATAVSCGAKGSDLIAYESYNGAVTDATPVYGNANNFVILICFANEEIADVRAQIDEDVFAVFDSEDDVSLRDYYYRLSLGKLSVHSVYPDKQGTIFIYKAPNNRSYYDVKNGRSGRKQKESDLLNGAIRAADQHFDFEGMDMDVNRDGYVDAVTFLVSGEYNPNDSNAWGGLLWPHSWSLSTITSGTPATLNNVKVDRFIFFFLQPLQIGLVCHEFGHVLGMPDLYNGNEDNYAQVWAWDLMHRFNDTPQYTLTYLRQKYLGVLDDGAVVDLKKGGTYSLKPTSTATDGDVFAYRIVISETESIWIEYRNNTVSTYDSELPGSGLIVYRVNTSVNGNEAGKNNSTVHPYEVYVYRPNVYGKGTRTKESGNLNKAYLSPDNPDFSTVGGRNYSNNYHPQAIYLTNGFNTGISVTADAVRPDAAIFTVDLNGFGINEVSEMYVEGTPTINYGEDLNIRVKIKVKGSSSYVTADPKNYRDGIVYDPTLIGTQIATVTYRDEDNPDGVTCTFKLVINDAIAVDGVAIKTEPVTSLHIGDPVDLNGLSINVQYVSMAEPITVTYSENGETNWIVEGVDTEKSGEYYAKITYVPFDVYVYLKFFVLSELSGVVVSEKNTHTVVDVSESLRLNVLGVNADDTKYSMSLDEYDATGYSYSSLYLMQTVTVTAKENDLKTQKQICFVRSEDLTAATVSVMPKTIYRYGEALDLSAGRLKLTFGSFEITVFAENYYSLFNAKFRPTERGRQTLTATIFGRELSVEVTVLPPDETFLRPLNDDVIVQNGYVLFKNGLTIDAAERSLSTYMQSLRFTYADGALKYEINAVTHHDLLIDRNVKIELYNEQGDLVRSYRVFVFGDGNNDGVVDEKDLEAWATAIFSNVADVDVYLDTDGDGKYTLTDFSVLVNLYGGRV